MPEYDEADRKLRDQFAAAALTGMTAMRQMWEAAAPSGDPAALMSKSAYEFADAMMKERSK